MLPEGHRARAQLTAPRPRAAQPRPVQRPDRAVHQPARPAADPWSAVPPAPARTHPPPPPPTRSGLTGVVALHSDESIVKVEKSADGDGHDGTSGATGRDRCCDREEW